MLEVEAKYRLPDPAAVEARLRVGGDRGRRPGRGRPLPERPGPRLRPDRRGVPVRRIGDRNLSPIRARVTPASKTRTELEVPCPSGDEAARSVPGHCSGPWLRPTAVVRSGAGVHEWPATASPCTHASTTWTASAGSSNWRLLTDEADAEWRCRHRDRPGLGRRSRRTQQLGPPDKHDPISNSFSVTPSRRAASA